MAKVRVGIGGWIFEPWRGSFYPKGLPQSQELAHASRHLTSIEVNGTYYRAPSPDTYSKWHDEVPEDFVFALKAPRYAANRKVLAEAEPSITRLIEGGIARLGAKLGPINWQFMATKKFDPADFEAFLSFLPAEVDGLPLRHAVELRHESFACVEAIEMMHQHNVAIVCGADSEYPLIADPTADFVYVRAMGTSDQHEAGYAPAALDDWARRAKSWAGGHLPQDMPLLTNPERKPRDVYLYVISGEKARNPAAAMALLERLGAS